MAIPDQELKSRWDNLQQKLNQNNYDAALIPLGVNFTYYFKKEARPSERLTLGILSKDSDPFIITPSFEKSNLSRSTGLDDIAVWEEIESPYKKVAKEFEDRGIGKNVIVDPHLWYVEVEMLKNAGDFQVTSGHDMIYEQRSVKSDWEITQLQAAAKASSHGILNAIPRLKVGMTEKEFLKIIQTEMSTLSGSSLAFGMVQYGENSAIPHGMPSDKKLQNDEVVLMDCGTPVNGYQGDITITIPFGKPKDFEKIYEIVYEANRFAFDADKEGMIAGELDGVARNHIALKGYGQYFTHRLGHGLGLEVHETPYIVATNSIPLKKNNCHTIEPGIYIPGKFGVRIEDDVRVTSTGAELLYETPRHNF
ncbi:MAG: aminopeptidase P family protein [Candidatus Heimdallarchaeota archaeon]|nr:aminopeptidase P family protein [Candidatus Heimdallarchaeota archaeon]